MANRPNSSEAQILEQYRVSFENVENQPEIATIMAEFGYDETLIAEGKSLFTKTQEAYNNNKKEDDETSTAYSNFSKIREELATIYMLHRKKGKVVFRKETTTLNNLGLKGSLPRVYVKWLETVKKFYNVALNDNGIKTKLARLKITPEELTATNLKIQELETARAEYLREKGESQDATKRKDAAFIELDDWMSEFYAVAKIALEDNPQLLESLGKFVRS